jgi:hypothetical protein
VSRDLHVDTAEEFAKPKLWLIYLVELLFDSGPFRIWTGWGALTIGEGAAAGIIAWDDGTPWDDGTGWDDSASTPASGIVWTGVGDLGSISRIDQTADGRAVGLELALGLNDRASFGMPSEVIDYALEEPFQGRPGRVYVAAVTEQLEIIGEIVQVEDGFIDQISTIEGTQNGVRLTLERAAFDDDRAQNRRFTSEYQKSVYAGDTFFDRLASATQPQTILWGRA